jgi:RNA polymerase sigma-70 factor (ECF subfamily)
VSNTLNKDDWDDDQLVALLQQGSEAAFGVLIQRYQPRLYKVALGITGDPEESQDVLQDVFLKVHQSIGKFKGQSKLSTWLHRITVNHCLNWKRRWKRRFRWHHQPLERDEGGDYPELGSDDYLPETLYREKELQHRFRKQLDRLPEQARAVFVLKELEGLSYEEIAAILNIKKGTVSSRLFYARKALKAALADATEREKVKK